MFQLLSNKIWLETDRARSLHRPFRWKFGPMAYECGTAEMVFHRRIKRQFVETNFFFFLPSIDGANYEIPSLLSLWVWKPFEEDRFALGYLGYPSTSGTSKNKLGANTVCFMFSFFFFFSDTCFLPNQTSEVGDLLTHRWGHFRESKSTPPNPNAQSCTGRKKMWFQACWLRLFLCSIMIYVIYCIVLYCIVLYYILFSSIIILYDMIWYGMILYYTILYYIILYYIKLYYIILYYIISYYIYHIIWFYIISYYTILYHVISYYFLVQYIILYYIFLSHVMLYYIVLYHIILYYIILYCIVLYSIISYHIISYHIIA